MKKKKPTNNRHIRTLCCQTFKNSLKNVLCEYALIQPQFNGNIRVKSRSDFYKYLVLMILNEGAYLTFK